MPMQTPHTDSDDYADFLDFIVTGGRVHEQLGAHVDKAALTAEMWAPRAHAMTRAAVAIAHASMGRQG